MAKPKIPNQKKKNEELEKRLAKYSLLIEQIYDTLNREAAKAVGRTDYSADAEESFRWSDYPETKKRIDDIQAQFVDDIGSTIYRSTSEEWQKSNVVQDLLATKVLRAYNAQVNGDKYKHFYQTNSDALKAFQKRKDKGMNLSAKLWKQANEYKRSLEAAISCAIEKGTSAVTLSKQISRYLVNFPELQKDYKERFGRATDVHDCEYNSMRLARTEINMAYREAENERWRQMDFVVGYEIKVSNNHGCKGVPKGQYHDICDELAGKYPKDFKWTGWHPQCRCYKIPILMTEDEFWEWDGRGEEPSGSVNEIKDVPDNFKRWAEKNSSRIAVAKKRGTLPYFVRDNEKTVERAIKQEKKLSVIENNSRIATQASARLKMISDGYLNGMIIKDGQKFKCGTITEALANRFEAETSIKIINREIYTGASSLLHHRTGTKAQKGKVPSFDDIINMPLRLGKMEVYLYKKSLVFTDNHIKYVLKPNYKMKVQDGKIMAINHISTSVLKEKDIFLEKNGYKKMS